MLRNEFQSCTVKCIQNVLTNDWYCKWSAAEPMLHAVKKLSISLSCPAAKTRITDLVSGKVQQVQRPRWHHMAPSFWWGFNRTWCFHSVVNWFVLMWLMDGDGWSSRSPSLSQTSDQGTEVPEGLWSKMLASKICCHCCQIWAATLGLPGQGPQRRSRWCGCVSNRDLRLPWDCGSGWIWCGRMIWSA